MKIGAADVYANHPIIVVGSSEHIDDPLPLNGAAAVASDTHVLVATRGQAALVRVSLWKEVGPRTGEVVFDNYLTMADQSAVVFDVEGLSRFSAPVGTGGVHKFVVLVDDRGFASRVDVIVDCGEGVRALTAVPGFPLWDVSVSANIALGPSDELALILSGHDCPKNRLAAAIKLIGESSTVRPAIRSFWIRMVIEWIRWLAPWQSLAESRLAGAKIADRLSGEVGSSIDDVAVDLASEILRELRKFA